MRRSACVLLHITSLPGEYGIGGFGKEAVAFAEKLKEAGMAYWQVLPFTNPGSGTPRIRVTRRLPEALF